jgi:hypothetical protein
MNSSGLIPSRAQLARARIAIFLALGAVFSLVLHSAHGANQPHDSWQELGQLNVGRFGCKAHSIDGQRAIVIAGLGDAGPANSAEILSISAGTWSTSAPMPLGFAPSWASWTAKLNYGYFLVAGGIGSFQAGDLRTFIYAVATDSWIQVGDLPQATTILSNLAQIEGIMLNDGRILIAGGIDIASNTSNASLVFRPSYANLVAGVTGDGAGHWDFTRDSSGNITHLNGASEHHELIKLNDGRALVIHGFDRRYVNGVNTIYRDTHGVQAELFDPGTGVWSALPNLPAIPGEDDRHTGTKGIRQMAGAVVLADGRVLIAGGFSMPADDKGKPLLPKPYSYNRSSAILFNPQSYDAGAYPWTVTSPMSVARFSHVMSPVPGSTSVVAAGGWANDGGTDSVEIYDSHAKTWHVAASMPAFGNTDHAVSSPQGCSATMSDGSLLTAGGQSDLQTNKTSRRSFLYRP